MSLQALEQERVVCALERWGERLEARVFRPDELTYCRARRRWQQHEAVRLAAKLAARRLLGGGGLREIEVQNDDAGAPSLRFHGRAAALAGGREALISLSHDAGLVVALVVLQETPQAPKGRATERQRSEGPSEPPKGARSASKSTSTGTGAGAGAGAGAE